MHEIKIEKVTEVSLAHNTETDIIKIGIIREGKMFFRTEMKYRLNKNNTVTVM